MTALRHHLLRHRLLAAWLVALALAMKLLVPSGYMIGVSAGSFTIELCSGYGPQKMAAPMSAAMPGMAHHPAEKHDDGKAEMPCAFAGLAAWSLAAADPMLLAGAVAFILLRAFVAAARPGLPGAAAYLRPPLRGPPTHG